MGSTGGMEENAPVLLPHVLVGNNSDKGHFLLEQGAIPQGSGLLVPGMAAAGAGTAQGARLEGQSLLKHSSGRVCSSINTRGHF